MENNITTVARINDVKIQIIESDEKMIAVRSICDALGIAFKPQFVRLKEDPILSSVVTSMVTTGADGKQYEMMVIPFRFVFGWLFRIDSRNVQPEAKESVERYQLECYNALYNYFTRHDEFLEFRDRIVEKHLIEYDKARTEFRASKEKVAEARERLNKARAVNEVDYLANKDQLVIQFD